MNARRWLRQRPLLYLWLPVVTWMGLIFFLSAQPELPHTGAGWLDPFLSAGAHMFLFAVLAALLARAVSARPGQMVIAFTLAMVYALSDEFHQRYVPGRHADGMDLLWDGLGAAFGLWAFAWLRRRSSGTQMHADVE